jgi:methyl-accepting chemotaxis protein
MLAKLSTNFRPRLRKVGVNRLSNLTLNSAKTKMHSTTSIKSRLVKGLLLIVLFFLVQAGLVWYGIANAKSTVVENTRKNTVATSELGSLAILAQQIRRYEKEYFVHIGNNEKRDFYLRRWQDTLGKIDVALTRIKTGSNGSFNSKDIEQVALWSAASAFYAAEMQKIVLAVAERSATPRVPKPGNAGAGPLAKSGTVGKVKEAAPAAFDPVEANNMIKVGKERFSAGLITGVEAMNQTKVANTLALASEAENMFNKVLAGVMFTVVVGVIVALLLSVSLPRTVTTTIDSLSVAAHEMSMGNLREAYDAGGVIEFAKLAEALNRMRLCQQVLAERIEKRPRQILG